MGSIFSCSILDTTNLEILHVYVLKKQEISGFFVGGNFQELFFTAENP